MLGWCVSRVRVCECVRLVTGEREGQRVELDEGVRGPEAGQGEEGRGERRAA